MQSVSTSKTISFSLTISKLFFLISFLLAAQVATAQVVLKSLLPYSQNFDSLRLANTWNDNTTLKGWYVSNATGSAITASSGTSTITAVASYGAANNTDRALGHATAATYYGIRIKNSTATTITGFSIQYAMEVWYRNSGNRTLTPLFDYQKNTSSLTGTNWSVATGSNGNWVAGGAGAMALNGNLTANRLSHTFSFSVTLEPGEEVMLRWQLPTGNVYNLGLDDVTITPVTGNNNVFYNTITAAGLANDITDVANWDTNGNGTGVKPTDFNSGIFVFTSNGGAHTLAANLALGANAKLIVSEGQLTIPSNRVLTGNVEVNDNAMLSIQNNTLPSLGSLGNMSTVYFGNTVTTVPVLAYGNLTLDGTNIKLLSGNITVRTSLTLSNNAKLQLGSYNLTLASGATITGGSKNSYLITNGSGSLKAEVRNSNTDVIFPIGTSNEYCPIKLKQAAGAVSDIFSVRVMDSVYAAYNNNVPVTKALKNFAYNKTWVIDEEVKGGSNMTISLEVVTNPLQIFDLIGGLLGFEINQAKIVHYENNQWDYAPTLPTMLNAITGGYSLSRSGITSFSPFSMMSGTPATLPVELTSFTASRKENGIICAWKTASETNNDFFVVERSLDGRTFKAIGTVKGRGTTSQASEYAFTDLNPATGLAYYRLQQTDFDGTTTYSGMVAVTANKNTGMQVTLAPNPTQGKLVLQTVSQVVEPVQISVWNTKGQLLLESSVQPSAAQNSYLIDLQQQASGIYLVKISAGNELVTLRAIKE